MNKRILELEQNILKARMDYYNNQPKVSDRIFDAWIDELKTLDPKNKAVIAIGAPVLASIWEKGKHQIPMGSLDKVNTPDEFDKWVNDHAKDLSLFITEKLDGLSIEVIYENGKLVEAITRGNGIEGEIITQNVIKMNGVQSKLPISFNGSLRGEIILRKSNHQKYFSEFANPRNAASGISKRLNSIGSEYLDILFYQALGDIDFKTEEEQFKWMEKIGCQVPNWKASSNDTKKSIKEISSFWRTYQDKVRETLDYDIDGVVVRVNDMEKQLALGEINLKPKGAIAWKFDNEGKETTITAIEWQVGHSGRLTPVAYIEPVMLCGAEVKKASIYNLAYIKDNELDVGAKVIAVRANDVVPRIEELVKGTGTTHKAPSKCPECHSSVKLIGEYIQCPNIKECPAQITGRIKNWVSELNILELGETLIEKLVASKLVNDVSDLYTLTIPDLASLDRMGDKSAENVFNSLWSHNPVPLELFIGGLSIPMIGSSTIKLLIDTGYDNLSKIRSMSLAEIEEIKGIGPVKANSLYEGLTDYYDVMEALLENGLEIKKKVIGPLTNKSFSFTGSMSNKRAVLEDKVIECGGTVKSSVGKGLTFLVINDLSSTSSKAVAAKKNGTALINEDEFLKMAK